jgi:hypothetical protein
MRIRAMCCAILSIAGLLSSNVEQAVAAEDSTRSSNLHAPKQTGPRNPDDSFSRMFPGLFPYAPATNEAREQAQKIGVIGGACDAKDDLSDPILSITDLNLSKNNPNNPNMTAGVTFFGQFLDHDMTLALKAPINEPTDPRRTTNFRSAELDSTIPAPATSNSRSRQFPAQRKYLEEAKSASIFRAMVTTTPLSEIAGMMNISSSVNSTWRC